MSPRDSEGDVLTVNIENVNEAPQFDEVAYWCILDESNVRKIINRIIVLILLIETRTMIIHFFFFFKSN